MASLVSLMTLLPPISTSRSETMPSATLAQMPLVGSLPPHSRPSISSPMGQGSRLHFSASAISSWTMEMPFATVRPIPPHCWMVMYSTRLPGERSSTALRYMSFCMVSQPRPTMSTLWTLGLASSPARIFSVICVSPWLCTQP